jgi:hypothetical protein
VDNRLMAGLQAFGEAFNGNEKAGKHTIEGAKKRMANQQRAAKIGLRRNAALAQAIQTEAGIRRIAANMANPSRLKLDYKGIFRKFVIVEQMPDGVPLIFDKDLPAVPAVKVGKGGSPRMIEMRGKRVELTAFEIVARVKVPYEELFTRRYRALDRAKDRLIEGIQLREDLIGFGLIDTASSLVNTPVTTAGQFDRDLLAKMFTPIENNRLPVASVLMSPYATQGIRRLDFQNLDQVGMQEVRETGYLGNYWGADFYVSDQVPAGRAYTMASPKFFGWMPLRKDLDVIPADDPDNVRLGLVGYQLAAITVFNALGAMQGNFNTAA